MITISRKEDCTGCHACAQICPKQCIDMAEDEQGFRYPQVDPSRCINCHLCEQVCPVLNQGEPRQPRAFAAKNKHTDVVMRSSSAGVFHHLASQIIAEGGIVFGARFAADWQVEHASAETLAELEPLMVSKYVQSRIGTCFTQAEKQLKAGRRVMFTGTPCQIAGLKKYLRKDYSPLLLAVEIVCHGCPSPLVWRNYLAHQTQKMEAHTGATQQISAISFRDKRQSWNQFGLSIKFASGREYYQNKNNDPYLLGFIYNLFLRPSCHACPAKSGKSGADIAMADFWHLDHVLPKFQDNKRGVSLVLTDSAHLPLLQGLELIEVPYADAVKYNSAINHDPLRRPEADAFWAAYPTQALSTLPSLLTIIRPPQASLMRRIARRLKRLIIH